MSATYTTILSAGETLSYTQHEASGRRVFNTRLTVGGAGALADEIDKLSVIMHNDRLTYSGDIFVKNWRVCSSNECDRI